MAIETNGTPVVMAGGDSGFGGAGFWGFLILAMFLFGGSGFGNNGNGNTNAIQADVNRGFDNQNLQAQTRDILSAVTGGTAQTIAASTANATNAINAIKDGNAGIIREFGNVENALTALAGKQQECCCSILRASDGINYNNALNTAAIQKTIVEEAQKNRDLLTGNRMADMQNQINQLQLSQALSGVVRYPSATTYTAGPNPWFGFAPAGFAA
jgi:hypothetical protein